MYQFFSRVLALSSWHNLCTHCKRQLLPSPGHGFGPILALWSYKLGIFLLHGPPQDCWTHSVHRGVVLTKRWQAEIWRVWSVSPLLLLPPTAQMSQRNTHPASPVSALHATAMPCLFLISIHLFTPVLQIRPPESAACCVGSAHCWRLPLEGFSLIFWCFCQ